MDLSTDCTSDIPTTTQSLRSVRIQPSQLQKLKCLTEARKEVSKCFLHFVPSRQKISDSARPSALRRGNKVLKRVPLLRAGFQKGTCHQQKQTQKQQPGLCFSLMVDLIPVRISLGLSKEWALCRCCGQLMTYEYL